MALSTIGILQNLLLVYAGYTLCKVVYRVKFSPLRAFKGPLIAVSTNLYRFYYDAILQGRFLSNLEVLHQQYGSVVRIGPNALHFNSLRAYFDIYKADSSVVKDPELYAVFGFDESSIGFIDPNASLMRRELLNPFFSRRAILELEAVIQSKVDKFVNLLREYTAEKPVNAHYAFRCLTLDVIWNYCFADDFNALDAKDFTHPILVSIQTQIRSFWVLKYIPILLSTILSVPDTVFKYVSPTLFVYLESRRRYTEMVDKLLDDPSTLHDSDRATIFHHLILPQKHLKGSNQIPSRSSLIDEAIALVQAGSDTVANTCTIGIFHVLDDPFIHKKLLDELRLAWPDEELQVSLQTLEKLSYLTAVIKESLRLSTGVVTPLSRVVGPQGAIIDGHHVPAGTIVAMGATFVHKNEEIFPEPLRFWPERWIENTSLNRYLVPFSRGPRMCLGMNLSWAELYLIFANVLRKLDLTPYNTSADDFRTYRELFVPVYDGREFHLARSTNAK
ncbi:cytochrome P450 [Dendrothele bispora CBS 962.96]|uniref:Cytochrome P450 n=1 Tax=Dendrothele bispora (strain CBS 962.96) TaxID=1314807 RepID=A0A4S8LNU1_DENBC|nr:cytochrome P450 [Dendrothele bispora CBS 962.96]